jgi:hypothetical protein
MPHLITNAGARQTHPLYKRKANTERAALEKKGPEKGPDKTEHIPKTYDAIKTACGADVKPTVRK